MDDSKLYAIGEPETAAARKIIHLNSARRHAAARQVHLVGRSWPRAQRTLRELLRQPRRAAPQLALQLRPYEALDRRRGPQPFDGKDRRNRLQREVRLLRA